METEIKVTAWSGAKTVMASQYASATGFFWRFNSSGQMFWEAGSGSWNTTGSSTALSANTYYKIKVTRTSGTVKLWYKEAAGSWTEMSYNTNDADGVTVPTSSSQYWFISSYPQSPGSSSFVGKIGYVKAAIGTDSFAYDGYKNQAAIVNLQNHGHMISGERVTGNTSASMAANFDVPVMGSGNEGAKVDSITQSFTYKKDSLTSTGSNLKLKVEQERGTSDDATKIPGVIALFNK